MGLHPLLDGGIVVPEAPLQILACIVRLLAHRGALEEGAQRLGRGQPGCLAGRFNFGLSGPWFHFY
jgi:hypothetical protein